jgi:acyl-CoA thioester hydrolase
MKIVIPANKKFVYEMHLPIRWGDMDAMGHVNNVSYFRYLETCRIDWFRSVGIMANPSGQGPVIINAFCNFYQEFTYPGQVLMKMYTSDAARTTFETWMTLENADQPGVVMAEGGATTIWVDFAQKKAATLPDAIRQLVSTG